MEVVVQIGTGRNDEIDEAGADQRVDYSAHADRRHRPRQRQAHRCVLPQHVAEKLGRLRQPTGIVAGLRIDLVDQVRDLFSPLQLQGIDHWQVHLVSAFGCGSTPPRTITRRVLHA